MTPSDLLAAYTRLDLACRLGAHFTLGELIASPAAARAGIDNFPADGRQPGIGGYAVVANLGALVDLVLEPVRALVGLPVRVNSGYRCRDLNLLVGGRYNSQHMFGQAADIEVDGVANLVLAGRIAASALPFDQLIAEECRAGDPSAGWVHVSVSPAGGGRRQILTLREGRYLPGLVDWVQGS